MVLNQRISSSDIHSTFFPRGPKKNQSVGYFLGWQLFSNMVHCNDSAKFITAKESKSLKKNFFLFLKSSIFA